MGFLISWPGAVFLFLSFFSSIGCVFAANSTEEKLPTFGNVIPILGAMERTDQDFQDGLALDLFSPKNRTLIVQQNKTPLPGHFVTGTSGEPFVALSNYSYILKMNETANDLIAKIEIPYDPEMLGKIGVEEANTYVGTLAPNKKSWVINDLTRNVHRAENNTRIIKMTSLDGEYLLLGRQTVDTSNIFVQYGQGATRTVNVTGGPGIQEAEFVDGLRLSIEAQTPLKINIDIKNGVNPGTLPDGAQSLNSFIWIVNTTNPRSNISAEMRVPFNRMILANLKPAGSSPTTMLTVAKRPLNATSGKFQPINADAQIVHELKEDRILVPGLMQLDGQYIILVTAPKNISQGMVSTNSAAVMPMRTSITGKSRRNLRRVVDTVGASMGNREKVPKTTYV